MDNLFLKAALAYAEFNWYVFPCIPKQKIPLGSLVKHGVKDATTDKKQIQAWWTKQPDANIAVACGQRSGIYVIDIDIEKASNVNGWHSLEQLVRAGNIIPKTVKQNTPRGGAHLFYKTSTPPLNRNSFLPGIDIRGDGYYVILSPSVHPNGGQYAWEIKLSPWECKFATFPDFLRPSVKSPWSTGPLLQSSSVIKQPKNEVLERASAYLATCDPAVQGCGGHDKLLWAAVCMVHGFLLSDSQAYDLLAREYNPRCVPPWDLDVRNDERDFRRKITEARKLTPQHQPGWLLDDDSYRKIDVSKLLNTEDIQRLINNSTTRKSQLQSKANSNKIETIEKELRFLTQPTGLLGEICSWINATAIRKQPLLTLGCALVFCGVLFGRKIKDKDGLRTNLYGMGVGKSSRGKFHAPHKIRKLCEITCSLDLLGGDDFTSGSSIELCLSRHPATMFMVDEIGHLLSNIKSGSNQHLNTIVPLLMKLYSSAQDVYKGKQYAEDGKQRTLIQPCCCIWGNSGPERFSDGFSPKELQDGWLSRCLIFRTDTKPSKTRGRSEMPPPVEICDKVSAWFQRKIEPPVHENHNISPFVRNQIGVATPMPPSQMTILATNEAEECFCNFDDETNQRGIEAPLLESLWDKGEENARRIALILAAGEEFDNPKITLAMADYACRLVRFLLEDFSSTGVAMITTSAVDAKKQKLLAIIKKFGIKGCQRREITRKSQWINGKEREVMLADLIEAEEIIVEIVGKKAIYRTTDHYVTHTEKIK